MEAFEGEPADKLISISKEKTLMKLIFATGNENKVREAACLLPGGWDVQSLKEIGWVRDIPETGNSLEENALIKSTAVWKETGINCFSEDTGLEVNSLNGEPGVYSARYAGPEGDADRNMDKLLKKLGDKNDRSARFRTVFCLILSGRIYLFEGRAEGRILKERRGDKGFGYDPIFVPDGFDKTFAELGPGEKNKISHRSHGLKQMLQFLQIVR